MFLYCCVLWRSGVPARRTGHTATLFRKRIARFWPYDVRLVYNRRGRLWRHCAIPSQVDAFLQRFVDSSVVKVFGVHASNLVCFLCDCCRACVLACFFCEQRAFFFFCFGWPCFVLLCLSCFILLCMVVISCGIMLCVVSPFA